ncbi:MAG: palindromic element RPE5 domain-containing protein [Rickettsia endosymbiont of Ixodes persulcatus]|nr:palindromic element RPE5 domain-containing protein [Rickettsia endosymbiont of Ixodes persulcatus]MCZ6902228.1 palindromic element RPE5 domain-containing protein [Rickettsia endosymbiont of Ixodes persulcatus]MCZ6902943.1 palindromic element RPE5 domain-containing protein [Rickettsia endosymbiont of Ixodes persulcatus]MCZ6908583.1 palindromic element RPE5 domain-containing protein [Rickettsia endosymbiont of Ixodes persulcatus]MCZ6909965.1 palindromic element RPE5 domain-containing protein [
MEKSKEYIRRGAEGMLNVQHRSSYKYDVANFSSSTSIYTVAVMLLTNFLLKISFNFPFIN